jgi:hypothetical protein
LTVDDGLAELEVGEPLADGAGDVVVWAFTPAARTRPAAATMDDVNMVAMLLLKQRFIINSCWAETRDWYCPWVLRSFYRSTQARSGRGGREKETQAPEGWAAGKPESNKAISAHCNADSRK